MAPEVSSPSGHRVLAAVLAFPDPGQSRRAALRELLAGAPASPEMERRVRASLAEAAAVEARLAAQGWRWIWAGEAGYPSGLAALSDPPLGLFVRGTVPSAPAVALVGARRATAYGREVAEHLGRELARGGALVVSGMARGVDGAAHRGALSAGGPTVAVWGTGPDEVYPREHRALAEEIAAHGGLLTEYPPGTPPRPHHFPERNRIIAGLVRVVVVVEASERSGALITARLALDEGRDVMAVPGSVFSRLSAGPNGLLRAGAAPVLEPADVLQVLGLAATPPLGEGPPELLGAFPAGESVTPDHLAAALDWPVARVLGALLEAELAGWVVREADGRYRRSRTRG
jgi:DNA processing protein